MRHKIYSNIKGCSQKSIFSFKRWNEIKKKEERGDNFHSITLTTGFALQNCNEYP